MMRRESIIDENAHLSHFRAFMSIARQLCIIEYGLFQIICSLFLSVQFLCEHNLFDLLFGLLAAFKVHKFLEIIVKGTFYMRF